MPLYIVRHGETERLIEASTASVAIRHAAKKIIIARPAKSKDVAALMGRGVQVEVAGIDPDPIPPVPLPEREPYVMSDEEIAAAEAGPREVPAETAEA